MSAVDRADMEMLPPAPPRMPTIFYPPILAPTSHFCWVLLAATLVVALFAVYRAGAWEGPPARKNETRVWPSSGRWQRIL
jgi:hypothetical protein